MDFGEKDVNDPTKIWNCTTLINYLLNGQPNLYTKYRIWHLRIGCFEQSLSKFFRPKNKIPIEKKKEILQQVFLTQVTWVRKLQNSYIFERDFHQRDFFIFTLFSTFLALLCHPIKKLLDFLPDYEGDRIEYLKKFRNFFYIEDIPIYYFQKVQHLPEIFDVLLTFPSYDDRESLFCFSSPRYLRYLRSLILKNPDFRFDLYFILPKIDQRIQQFCFPPYLYGRRKMEN
jgi:hypothetical protein